MHVILATTPVGREFHCGRTDQSAHEDRGRKAGRYCGHGGPDEEDDENQAEAECQQDCYQHGTAGNGVQ